MIRQLYIFAIILILLSISCKKEVEVVAPDITYKYYPNQEGNYIVYHIDSLFYNRFTSKTDTFSYDIKEKVVSFFTDGEGRKSQRIERYLKVENQWNLITVYKAFVSNKRVEKTEENITSYKLVFPLKKNLDWIGNPMDTAKKKSFKCIDIHGLFNNSKLNFDSCAVILHESDSTLIYKKETKEIYAINVGMIYKRIVNIEDKSSQINMTKPISKRANSGTDVIIYATSFGKE